MSTKQQYANYALTNLNYLCCKMNQRYIIQKIGSNSTVLQSGKPLLQNRHEVNIIGVCKSVHKRTSIVNKWKCIQKNPFVSLQNLYLHNNLKIKNYSSKPRPTCKISFCEAILLSKRKLINSTQVPEQNVSTQNQPYSELLVLGAYTVLKLSKTWMFLL